MGRCGEPFGVLAKKFVPTRTFLTPVETLNSPLSSLTGEHPRGSDRYPWMKQARWLPFADTRPVKTGTSKDQSLIVQESRLSPIHIKRSIGLSFLSHQDRLSTTTTATLLESPLPPEIGRTVRRNKILPCLVKDGAALSARMATVSLRLGVYEALFQIGRARPPPQSLKNPP